MSVKIKKRGRPTKNGHALNKNSIIEQAKLLMEQEGKVPSIRQLASSLEVDAMAIYHYFKNKNALLEAITISLINDVYMPHAENPWQKELMQLAKSYLLLLRRYSGLLETLLSMNAQGPAYVFNQRFQIVISGLNLDSEVRDHALDLLVDYLHGFALAMKCNNAQRPLDIEMSEGAITLICFAISSQQGDELDM
jgi:AcrR family transcriptional regulator